MKHHNAEQLALAIAYYRAYGCAMDDKGNVYAPKDNPNDKSKKVAEHHSVEFQWIGSHADVTIYTKILVKDLIFSGINYTVRA